MQLPLNLPDSQMQTKWKSILDPIIASPMVGVSILPNVSLANGVTVINHKLGRTQQGWFLVDKQEYGDVKRTAAFNDLTLTLTASAAMTVNIGVF